MSSQCSEDKPLFTSVRVGLKAQREFGLSSGAFVGVAMGDHAASVRAAVEDEAQKAQGTEPANGTLTATLNIGTSAQIAVVLSPEFSSIYGSGEDSPYEIRPYFNGMWFVV